MERKKGRKMTERNVVDRVERKAKGNERSRSKRESDRTSEIVLGDIRREMDDLRRG